jgi:hypothetical protein
MRAYAARSVLGRMPRSREQPAVRLAFGGHRVAPPDRSPDESYGALGLWHDEAALSVAYGPSVGARVEAGEGVLGGHAPNVTRVFHQVAPFMLASLLAPYGRFVLHAAAIQRDGRAVLVLGGSGAGKSTLILGALENGWSVLSDDLVLVRAGQSGPMVSGIPKALRVPGEVLRDTGPGWLLYNDDSRGRAQLKFDGWDRAWHPVGAVVLVAHGDGDQPQIKSIDVMELLAILMQAMLSRQKPNLRRYIRIALALTQLPSFILQHSREPENRPTSAADAMGAYLLGLSRR